jgi:hypothetical protein
VIVLLADCQGKHSVSMRVQALKATGFTVFVWFLLPLRRLPLTLRVQAAGMDGRASGFDVWFEVISS